MAALARSAVRSLRSEIAVLYKVRGFDGEERGGLGERGGAVFVCGSDGKKRGAIGVSPVDNGVINLWDKRGNRIDH